MSMDEKDMPLKALCPLLLALLEQFDGKLYRADAICQTGESPQNIERAFRYLDSKGKAKMVGGPRRGYWLLWPEAA